jgi:hypothetical protein
MEEIEEIVPTPPPPGQEVLQSVRRQRKEALTIPVPASGKVMFLGITKGVCRGAAKATAVIIKKIIDSIALFILEIPHHFYPTGRSRRTGYIHRTILVRINIHLSYESRSYNVKGRTSSSLSGGINTS